MSACIYESLIYAGYHIVWSIMSIMATPIPDHQFLDPEVESPNATLVVFVLVVVLGISSLKSHKAFLMRSAAQRNFANTFVLTFPTDLRSQIFKLISN